MQESNNETRFTIVNEFKRRKVENQLSVYENLYIHADHIRVDSIPSKPEAKTTSVVKKHYPLDEGGDGWIVMTLDNKVSGNRQWVALNKFQSGWCSGEQTSDIPNIITGFINPTYGSEYIVNVFDGKDERIYDSYYVSEGFNFNYDTGILVFDHNRPERGLNESDSIKIKVYRYQGKFLSDLLKVNYS